MDEVLKTFGSLDSDDLKKMALCLNILVFRTGFVDGTYEPDAELYRFVQQNYNDIDNYLRYLGLKLLSDTDSRQVWIDLAEDADGGLYAPFASQPMNSTQIMLLCVLQKRLATGTSSRETGNRISSGVLLTETDILQDMFPYLRKGDDKYKKDVCIAAINRFTNDLGLLRIVARRFPVADGQYDTVYRASPFIQHHFHAGEMDRIREAYLAQAAEKETDINDDAGTVQDAEISLIKE